MCLRFLSNFPDNLSNFSNIYKKLSFLSNFPQNIFAFPVNISLKILKDILVLRHGSKSELK